MATGTYTMQALEMATGISARTLRYWIREKAVARPIGAGRGARYDERHVVRARVVQRLRNERVPLRAIRARIEPLSEADLRALLPPEPRAATPDGVPLPPPDPSYPSSTWEVVELMEGILLFVNPNKGQLPRRIADAIYRYYGPSRGAAAR